jgi:hypothetical protein
VGGALRELFPHAIWLEVDREGGRFLWAIAQTVWPAESDQYQDAGEFALPGAFPYVYRAATSGKVGVLSDT